MTRTITDEPVREPEQYDETADLSREEKLQKLKRPYMHDGPTILHPEGRKPWKIDHVDEETGTVTFSCNPPRELGATDEVDVDNVFKCECQNDQWVVGGCMKCATNSDAETAIQDQHEMNDILNRIEADDDVMIIVDPDHEDEETTFTGHVRSTRGVFGGGSGVVWFHTGARMSDGRISPLLEHSEATGRVRHVEIVQ